MRGNTHAAGGVAAGLAFAAAVSGGTIMNVPAVIAVSAFGGLLPDIDHGGSKITHKAGPIGKLISMCFKHRGVLHTPIVYLALWAVLLLALPDQRLLATTWLVGVLSHLTLDTLNPTGISWLYPITWKKFHVMKIRTGSAGELVVQGLLILLVIAELALFVGFPRF